MSTHAQLPTSLTKLVLASGTPLSRDPYNGLSLDGLLDDPIEAIGEVGRNALPAMLMQLLRRTGGDVSIAPASVRGLLVAPAVPHCDALIAGAREQAEHLEAGDIRSRALSVLDRLRAALPANVDAERRVVLTQLDDASVIIEWPLPGRRLGFSIHADATESGWFFVSTPEWGNIMASGALNDAPMEQLVEWALVKRTT